MLDKIKIRQPGRKDKDQLMRLVSILYKNDDPKQIDIWDKGYTNYLSSTYVAEKERKIIAYLSLGGDSNSLLIGDLCVLPEYRKQGIASFLVERAINRAVKYGKRFIRVDTPKNNRDSQRLYKKFGFEIVGETEKGLLILKKSLKPKEI